MDTIQPLKKVHQIGQQTAFLTVSKVAVPTGVHSDKYIDFHSLTSI